MAKQFDLVIRGATVVDGTGAPSFGAGVAVAGGRIAEVGRVAGAGAEEIDGRGQVLTPGFVDIHTHYDGQVTWANRIDPSSQLGVTTVVMGNCGVGFAPCRRDERDDLVHLMEGVEDIPEVVLTEGLPWNWQSFPEYLDALAERQFDIAVAAQVGHAPIRLHVMGERGARREPATERDRREMAALAAEAVQAGALGFSTSRTINHRSSDGSHTPTLQAAEEELIEIGLALKQAGAGVIQLISDFDDVGQEFGLVRRLAERSGRPLSLSLLQVEKAPDRWREVLGLIERSVDDGLAIKAQVASRGVGVIMGLELTRHPLVWQPGYQALMHLPLGERVEALRQPEVRARILAEPPTDDYQFNRSVRYDRMFVLDPLVPDYEPLPSNSIAAMAERAGVPAAEYCYDLLLQDGGTKKLFRPQLNYVRGDCDDVLDMMRHRDTVIGLGDGGAHCKIICDASFSTFMLSHWVCGRTRGERVPLEWAVQAVTQAPAATVQLFDRGVIGRGYRADLNLIDLGRLRLHSPELASDLPAGGQRLVQRADGYAATVVAGVVTARDGVPTGALPGRLVRGSQRAAAG